MLAILSLAGCTGWVPFLWAGYGESEGLGADLSGHRDLGTEDLERQWIGFGVAYGGWLPGLMEPRFPPASEPRRPGQPGDPDGHDEMWHFLDWFADLGPWPLLVLCALVLGLAVLFRERIKHWIPKFWNSRNSKNSTK